MSLCGQVSQDPREWISAVPPHCPWARLPNAQCLILLLQPMDPKVYQIEIVNNVHHMQYVRTSNI